MNAVSELNRFGQSCWLDNLTRDMLEDGSLRRRIAEQGITGITANPATFEKALSGGTTYKNRLHAIARSGLTAQKAYDELAIQDTRDACDLFRDIYERSEGRDGFVSLEVSPHLAHDTRASVREGYRIFNAVGRRNLLIKIPGTMAGLPAIEELLYLGVNVNITLLFSVARYRAVFDCYMRALERRSADGKSVHDVASVASFFLSRIDVLIDSLLTHRVRLDGTSPFTPHPDTLRGKTAIACAKLAYAAYRQRIKYERWRALTAAGARPQRLLWASTSIKSSDYEESKYIDPLIGPDTVTTLPEKTLDYFAQAGHPTLATIARGINDASRTVRALRAMGIDLKSVSARLEDEGIEKFVQPYHRALSLVQSELSAEADKSVAIA